MAALHSWAALLPGWLLFVVFLFGTTAFFRPEIDGWMRPELSAGPLAPRALDAAGTLLQTRAAGAERWTLVLPGPRGGDALRLGWQPSGKDAPREKAALDPSSGREVQMRETRGGWFLYRLHFDLHYMPVTWARILVSIASLAMLVAILSGVVTHRRIFADFFTLRLGKGQRSWLDAHNVAGVFALPFHLMITYTGLVTLLFTLMPWAITANFPSEDAFYEQAYPPAPVVTPSGKAAALLPPGQLIAHAENAWGDAEVERIVIHHPGDAAAMAELWPRRGALGASRKPVYLVAASGIPLQPVQRMGGAAQTESIMVDLHTGLFADTVLRWLYFASGVIGTAMVATGLVLWTAKRRAKLPDPARPDFGFRLVERLNIGVITGAPAGIAAYFLANRLLPVALNARAETEVESLFIGWAVILLWTIVRPARRAWMEGLAVCAAIYALVPLVNAFTTTRGFIPSLTTRDWVFAGFDLVMLGLAAGFACASWMTAHGTPLVRATRRCGASSQPLEART